MQGELKKRIKKIFLLCNDRGTNEIERVIVVDILIDPTLEPWFPHTQLFKVGNAINSVSSSALLFTFLFSP